MSTCTFPSVLLNSTTFCLCASFPFMWDTIFLLAYVCNATHLAQFQFTLLCSLYLQLRYRYRDTSPKIQRMPTSRFIDKQRN
ncbi:hypothetical protein GDO81_000613 [Engystomops pustulosus]|uniref:Secreted protein n=1 Tax=Engystomops pustulosus TaxID=76066 RepID=A0AAV6YNE4_ENGPU|nr:hypothetical protein GDO81_022619 [Engystomops pustulosus]KAG8592749.1 hypothetical protein GDO81_000613 [Engystomops pustulosus]